MAPRLLAAAGVLLAAVTLTACATSSPAPQATHSPSAPAEAVSGADFAHMMILHHEQAVVMAELAETNTTNPDVLDLARRIKAAQQPEIDQMNQWLDDWGALADRSAHAHHSGPGMLTAIALAEIAQAHDDDFDALFLSGMTVHHLGAIAMAVDVVDSPDPRVAGLAKNIIRTQTSEIAEMHQLLQQAAD